METKAVSYALITARAGSTRLPRKNHALIDGVPLWRRAVDFATEARLRPIVDTDDEDILSQLDISFCLSHRRKTLPESQGGTHWQAIEDVCKDFGLCSFVLLQPTSPYRSLSVLESCLTKFDGSGPVLTHDGDYTWDGNIGIWSYPVIRENPKWVRNDTGLSLQIDTKYDYLMARLTPRQG